MKRVMRLFGRKEDGNNNELSFDDLERGTSKAKAGDKTPPGKPGEREMGPGGRPISRGFKADMKALTKMAPYLWPKDNFWLRVRVVLSLSCIILAKVFTVLNPVTYKYAIDALSHSPPYFPWQWVLAYAGLRWLSATTVEIRDTIFTKVGQMATKTVSLDAFRHLHNLSLRFHIHRETGTILRALDRGTASISTILSMLLFNLVPTFVEMIFVCGILISLYEIWFSVFTFMTITGYITWTIVVTEWRTKFRQEFNTKDNEATNKAVDSLINFETVKYFCNEQHEIQRYDTALEVKMQAALKSQSSLALLNGGQSGIIALGSLAVMLLAAKRVVDGDMTVGDFVLVNTYLLQLYLPLGWLGTSYRMIKQAVVDLDNMFEIMAEPQEVKDLPAAPRLALKGARAPVVRFNNVSFGYDSNHKVLDKISLEVPSGHTVAVVGKTGCGKSTLIRLLFRLYDVTSGRITIDGQDTAAVTQKSLRDQIGVVPQDTVLFNDTIFYNIAYAKVGATQEEVEQAAKMARIHDFIMKQTKGYDTKVGERGLRLSGGEKQRVAIARAILKNPPILVFDEATSALDTGTEKEIQASLKEISVERTTLVVAHRLSTIMDADEILVFGDGGILERGNHNDLIALNGVYKEMWLKQLEQQILQSAENEDNAELAQGRARLASSLEGAIPRSCRVHDMDASTQGKGKEKEKHQAASSDLLIDIQSDDEAEGSGNDEPFGNATTQKLPTSTRGPDLL